ncbi:zinc finger CCCH domain-containing protein [Aspergillus alliaceus]|uniref:zinc finger CCCH domain-containing protein n=1 Tax=Petromyces alliaceus TaxID=209559 RepID=UPI0012A72C64|nr:uncharacterized protein BDW43DRAFT_266984 [Aspergillus alliaceus]KAB8236455.1 hypothetical protein BDW43DRAFT_266984 [Aspergillus alliaceus]
MLGDTEIQALDSQLATVLHDNQQHHEKLQNLLQRFHLLLDNYTQLKSDYEEEKAARERYKKQARGQERNPFVLVLVDGDGYLFKDHLIKAGAEGGIIAARLLSDSIRELLSDQPGSQADQCRIMVRIYSNVLGLSKILARGGLVGNEARSLSPFAASFTRSQDLFDYIDAGDKKEGADYKIREIFRLFADNNQCKHIFFAGCHDAGYLSLLTPYRGKADRITLIKAASFHPEYDRLNLPVREIPAVFTSTPVSPPISGDHVVAATRPVCKHFQKGICRFGKECNKLHAMPNQQFSKNLDDTPAQSWSPVIKVRDQEFYAKFLPRVSSKSQEFISLNKDGERIDTYCPMPPPEEWEIYYRRAKRHKLCNKYHLGGECGNLNCEFDHSPIESACLNVMMYIMRQHLCSRGASCRSIKCYLGHMCQKESCKGTKPCKFGRQAHVVSLQWGQWAIPIEHEENSPVSESLSEANSDPNNTFSYLMRDAI